MIIRNDLRWFLIYFLKNISHFLEILFSFKQMETLFPEHFYCTQFNSIVLLNLKLYGMLININRIFSLWNKHFLIMIGFNKVERTKTENKLEVSCRFTNTINLIMQNLSMDTLS